MNQEYFAGFTPTPGPFVTTTYHDVVFEHPAYREPGKTEKKLLRFDESLERLRSAGFERHPRPQEAFGLIIDGLEGKLSSTLADVQNDMLEGHGEWLSLAFERKGKILIAYFDPEGLVWNGRYVKSEKFSYACKLEFDIAGIEPWTYTPLNEFGDAFVTAIYGRPFKDLPKEIQKGDMEACAFLPHDGELRPVGRYIGGVGCYSDRASRGVRYALKNSAGNQGFPSIK